MTFGIALSIWLFATAEVSSGAVKGADVSIASISYAPAPDDNIGPFRAGALCLPAGQLHWRDVSLPDKADLIAALDGRLRGAVSSETGQRADVFGNIASTRYRVALTVENLKLSLCGGGFGPIRLRVKGKGALTVRWDTFERITRTKIGSNIYSIPLIIERADPRRDSSILFDAIINTVPAYMAKPPL